jgi:hypothetical protein
LYREVVVPPPPADIKSVRFDIYINTHDEVEVPISPMDILATLIVKSVAEPTIVLPLRPMTVVSKLPTVTYTFMPTVGVGSVRVTPDADTK